jgi:hypothetical protein
MRQRLHNPWKSVRQRNWTRLTRFFEYPAAIRQVVYTTNTVEGFHPTGGPAPNSVCDEVQGCFLIRNSFVKTALSDHTTHHRKVEDALGQLVTDRAATGHFIR